MVTLSTDLLCKRNTENRNDVDDEKNKIEKFFSSYNVKIECKDVYFGVNSITYVIDLMCKTSVKTINSFKDDLKMHFGAVDIEFENVINGTSFYGIHLIYEKDEKLLLGDLIDREEFKNNEGKVPLILGTDFSNNIVIRDLASLPHLLISGTTGTGKSTYLNSFIIDILYKYSPDEIKLVLIDTRKTNFSMFNGIPNLLIPVVTNAEYSKTVLMY